MGPNVSINIDNVYKKLENDIKANPKLKYWLINTLSKLNTGVQTNYIQKYEEGFCSKFTIPDKDINTIFIEFPSITDAEIKQAFVTDWGIPPNVDAHMHNNVYYHKLLLLMYYAAKNNEDTMGEKALSLVLFRIWNGRLIRLIKWCNPEIMAAAISKTTSKLIKQYHNPLDLIQNYFAKTIYTKYKPYVLRDSVDTKRTFEQCYNRVKQLFGSNNQKNLDTGATRYLTGLQPEYFKAHQNRNRITNIGTDPDAEDKFSSSEIESTIEHVSRFITTYKQITYNPQFISMVTNNIKGLSTKSVGEILEKIHKFEYHDIIREIVELIYRRLRGMTHQQMCSPMAYDYLKTKIISSKNTKDVQFLKEITDKLLDKIFKTSFPNKEYDYLNKSDNHRSQLRNIIFYGIVYNIQKATCEYK